MIFGSRQSLGQAGEAFSGAISESAQVLAERLQGAVKEANGASTEARNGLLIQEAFYFVLHVTDRIALSRLQISGRELFLNALLTALSAQIGEGVLRAAYNESQARFGQFAKNAGLSLPRAAATAPWSLLAVESARSGKDREPDAARLAGAPVSGVDREWKAARWHRHRHARSRGAGGRAPPRARTRVTHATAAPSATEAE